MSQIAQTVAAHYGRGGLGERILAALAAAGKNVDNLSPDDLAPVDEFHTGQRNATMRLAELAGVTGTERVLDIGSGIGGPSRYLARRFGCAVTGIDLTAEFVGVATMLAERTGLADRVSYRQGNALDLPFDDASFDLVWSQNAAMNIADRERLYREMRRVLKRGGRVALQDVAAGPGGAPHYPTPWARDESISFLLTPADTRVALERAGLRVVIWREPSREALDQAIARTRAVDGRPPPALGLHLLIGPEFATISRNMLRNLQEKRITLVNAIATPA